MAQDSLKLLKERRKVEQDIAKLKKETKDWGDQELRQLQELENRKKRIAKLEGKAAADRDKAELAYLGVASRVSTLQEDIGKRVERNGRSVFQLSNSFKIAASNMQPMVRGGVEMKDTYTGFASLMDDVAMNAEKAETYLQGGSENMVSTTSAMSSKIEELSQNAEGYFTSKSGEQFKIDPAVQKEAEKLLEVYTGLDSRFKEATMTMGEGFNNINDLQSQSVGLAGEMALSYGKIGTSGFSVSVDKAKELYETSVRQAKLIKSVTLPDMKKKIKFMLKELELINPLSDEYKTMQSSIEEMQGDMEEMDAAAESMVDTAERNLKAADQMRIMNNQIAASSELILGPFNKLKGAMEALPFGGLVSSLVDLEGIGTKFGDTIQKNLLGMLSEPTVALETFALKSDKAGEKTGKRFRDLSTGQLVAGDDEAVLTLNDGMTTFTNIMDSAKDAVGKMGEGFNKLTGMPVAMMGPLLAVVGIIMLAAKVAQIFFGGMMDTRKELGVTVAEAGKLQSAINTTALEFGFLGVSAEDVAGVSDSIRNNMGGIAAATQENVSALTQMTALYGVSGENTGFLATQMKAVGASSVEAATAQMESVALLARANGVAPGPIMNDVAEASEAFAGFAKDGGENVFKAAIAAKKLGLGMSEVEAISDSLLDFESSINAEMEASMLLGRSVNMDKARAAALAGDLETQMKEVAKQAGSVAQWESLNVVQRKALAAAAGIEVSAMAKMVANQEELNNMSSAEKAHRDYMAKVMEMLGKAWASFLSIGKLLLPVVIGIGIAVALAFYPVTLAIIAVTALGAAFNWVNKKVPILGTVLGVVLALMTAIWVKSKLAGAEMSGGMMEGAKSMASGLKDKLGGMMGGAGDAAKEKGGGLLSGLKDKLTGGGTPTKADGTPDKRFGKRDKTKAVKKPKAGKKGGGGMESMFGKDSKIDYKKMIQGAAAMLIVAVAMFVMAKALQEFAKVTWEAIAMAGVTLLGLVVVLGILGKLKGQLIQGAVAMLIMSVALIPFAFALQMFTGVDFGQVALAGVAMIGFAVAMGLLGFAAPYIIMGAVAMAIMSVALIPFSLALRLFTGIDFAQVAMGGVAMLGLGLSLGALGFMAPAIIAGSWALGIMTVALVGLGVALILIGTGMKLFQGSVSSIVEPLTQLASIVGPLLLLSVAFAALGISMGVMAIGALMLLPVLPVLMALSAMGLLGGVSLGGGGEEAEDGGGEEANPVELKLGETNQKLDRLIALLGEDGVVNENLRGIRGNTGDFTDSIMMA